MTREEAKNKVQIKKVETYPYGIIDNVDEVIDKIFDEFGEKLQDKDDEIELLKCRIEEAMKPKTCDTCTYFDNELWGGDCLNFSFRCTSAGAEAHRPDDGFCCNRYKSKDS